MPEKRTKERARRDKRQGKAPTTQAGEFVHEEMEHAKRGKHPVASRKQAIAIGLSKARRAGVDVPAKKGGRRGKAKSEGKTSSRSRSSGRSSSRSKSSRSGGRHAPSKSRRSSGRSRSRSR